MRKSGSIVALLAALVVASCGGSSDEDVFKTPAAPGTGGGPGGPVASSLTVTSSSPTILSDGSTTATITALARDANNNLIAGVGVTFTATSGGVAVTQATTDASGAATATLSTAGDPTIRTITVTAAAGTLSSTVNVQVVAASGGTTVQMGTGTGAQFQPGVIGISNANLSAGGSTSLSVTLQQSSGTLFTQSADITFSSSCQAQGLATITSPVNTTTGIATATYTARGCSGSDVITATATVGGTALSANGTVTVAAAAIGSIVFESATPTNISLQGSGGPGRPETSTVIFRVLDQSGGPRAGASVTFALNTSVGGITFAPATGQSDATGRVQTVVQAGTVATAVRVTATVTSVTPNISTQSSALTITTGIPDQDSFSLAVQCPNVEAWNIDGVTVPVTVRLSDRFNNPAPDGTAVALQTEGGSIQPQCQTAGGIGACTVNWTSSNPRPGGGPGQSGRSTLFATAIGEESFADANGNGAFDNGETFVDLAERFSDYDEDSAFDTGVEPIYDFNNNGTRDAADGVFNGVLCRDTTGRCNASAVTTGIGVSNLIIMSASTPAGISPAAGTQLADVSRASGGRSYSFTFADLNNNPMPSGTIITATVTGNGLGLGQPSSFTVPCTTVPTTYSFTVTAQATSANSGTLTLSVRTPGAAGSGGVETVLQYPFNVVP
jgi:hypothetical protein